MEQHVKKHLSQVAFEMLKKTSGERIEFIRQDHWVDYPRALEIIKVLDDMLSYPPKKRMPNLLIISANNNGKTMFLHKYNMDLHPPDMNLDGDSSLFPVVSIQCPPVPSEMRLYTEILERLSTPYKIESSASELKNRVMALLKMVRAKMFIIEEIQNISCLSPLEYQKFVNVLKYLSNEMRIPFVAIGGLDSLKLFQKDSQLLERFKVIEITRWSMNEDYLIFLNNFEKILPLKKSSNLGTKEIAEQILKLSNGTVGEIVSIVSEAAILAIKLKTERISIEILNQVKSQYYIENKGGANCEI